MFNGLITFWKGWTSIKPYKTQTISMFLTGPQGFTHPPLRLATDPGATGLHRIRLMTRTKQCRTESCDACSEVSYDLSKILRWCKY